MDFHYVSDLCTTMARMKKTRNFFFLIYLCFKLNLKCEKKTVFQFLYLLRLSSDLKNSKCYLMLNSL